MRIRNFCNSTIWDVQNIPDPRDPDPARYAVLAALTHYQCEVFNGIIAMKLREVVPAAITSYEAELNLQRRIGALQLVVPKWATRVPRLQRDIVIPTIVGGIPEPEDRCDILLNLGFVQRDLCCTSSECLECAARNNRI